MACEKKTLLYENPLACKEDINEFVTEGKASITFSRGCMRMENALQRDVEKGIHANFILWCKRDFPDNIAVSWNFRPLTDAGLAMAWVAAAGKNGEDLFDPNLSTRDGDYPQYFRGDINALHVSYYRRNPSEINFRTCNLRKSRGFHLVCQSGDPLPDSRYACEFYRVEIVKSGPHFLFSINDFLLFHWIDDNTSFGPVLTGGKIGFRQMAGLIAEYSNLQVHEIAPVS